MSLPKEVPASFGSLLSLLPPPSVAPLSFLHPAALLLFSDRISYVICPVPPFGEILMAETFDGIRFLPIPPRLLFDPMDRESGSRFLEQCRKRAEAEEGFPGRMDHCPPGVLPGVLPRFPSLQEVEYALRRRTLVCPTGNSGRSLRWEANRFGKDHPKALVRPVKEADFPSVLGLVREFGEMKRSRAADDLERLMVEDMMAAHERAVIHHRQWNMSGWVLEEGGRILGVGWYGLSQDETTLVCFLEARDGALSNMGSILTRQVLLAVNSAQWVNMMGAGGLSSVDRSKRTRPHDLEIPLYTVSFL